MIERLRELERAATPGPWVSQSVQEPERERWFVDTHAYGEGPEPVIAETYPLGSADAALIVAMRNALPALLDVAEAARRASYGSWGIENSEALRAALAALDSGTSVVTGAPAK